MNIKQIRQNELLARARANQKKFRKEFPEKAKMILLRYRQSRRILVNELKSKPCLDCGVKLPPECMDFDHVKGDKVAGIWQMYTWKLERLMEEISKCDLVCANCHRIRTFNRKTKILDIKLDVTA